MEKINEAEAKTTFMQAMPMATYSARSIVESVAFTAAIFVAPAILAHTPSNQWITGIVVNALLFLAVWRVGLVNAVLIGIVPSSIALFRGLLPAPMAMMIPYIILGNALMVTVFSLLGKRSFSLGVLGGALLKTALLWIMAALILKIPAPIAQMMQWPQLITALAGGFLALGATKFVFPKKGQLE